MGLLVTCGALFGVYALVLHAMGQLALQSLVKNRRGMASALIHAWRLIQNDPRATLWAAAGDLGLTVFVLLLSWGLGQFAVIGPWLGGLLLIPAWTALAGVAGLARAGYWASAYRALGGLGAEEGVPGLELAS